MAGRTPKPTNLLELTGAFRKNPNRKRVRENEPQSPPIGGPPKKWLIFHPDTGYQDAERLRAIWDNCVAMWPWLQYADRDSLESYCKLKLKEDKGLQLSGAEITAMLRIRSELGGTGAGRARLGMQNAPHREQTKEAKRTDPRAAFLARKIG